MGQKRLSALSLMAIESELVKQMDFEDLLNDFASRKDLQTVGNQPPHSVRLRDLFSDSDATLSRYSGAPGRPLAATTPFLGHRTGVLKTALWRPTVFLELQSSGTTSRLSPKIGPVIGLSVAVGCQLSGGPENHPGERDHFASESEMSPQIGLNGAVGGPRSGGLREAPEEAYSVSLSPR
ncbi:unnamed protein product [Boreogadus saida]